MTLLLPELFLDTIWVCPLHLYAEVHWWCSTTLCYQTGTIWMGFCNLCCGHTSTFSLRMRLSNFKFKPVFNICRLLLSDAWPMLIIQSTCLRIFPRKQQNVLMWCVMSEVCFFRSVSDWVGCASQCAKAARIGRQWEWRWRWSRFFSDTMTLPLMSSHRLLTVYAGRGSFCIS